ncbi:MFS transporter [Amycolatopsis sp. 195334CR]|uniref:MFS transporter n=1 Tax=Amycolatopsis sp. 195334CR TaxID=2814588 RepID=UPI001A901889|nr:MFS transporter [Amycolatopsis sp. 195334CR]MBN6036478.1 MFS transporter [Amycolatopsis sp. 195334CR]
MPDSSRRTYVLALGAFSVGTSAYVVAGLLPALVSALNVSTAAAAQLVTAFAIAYAIGAPLLSALTSHWERRTLLVAALAVTAAGNFLAALVTDYPLLFAARIVTAIGAAVYTPVASAVAAELSPPERRGRAVAMVFGGLTVATILGVPLGSLMSQHGGYRLVFALVGVVALAGAVAVRLMLPSVAPQPPVPFLTRFTVAKDPRVLALLGATALGCLGAFTVYTFITPLLAETAGVHGTLVSLLLFAYGAGGVLGNSVGGRITDRWGSRRPLIAVMSAMAVTLAVMPFTATSVAGAAITLFVWGLSTWSVNPPIQHRLIEVAGSSAGLALSLNASAIYLGVGLAGVAGGVVTRYGGPTLLPTVAAALTVSAGSIAMLAWRRRAVVAPPVPAAVG